MTMGGSHLEFDQISERLIHMCQIMKEGHAKLVYKVIQDAKAHKKHHTDSKPRDLFAGVAITQYAKGDNNSVCVRSYLWTESRQSVQERKCVEVTPIRTCLQRVPSFYNICTMISNNILGQPISNIVPYPGELSKGRYRQVKQKLIRLDKEVGCRPQFSRERGKVALRRSRSRRVMPYLLSWFPLHMKLLQTADSRAEPFSAAFLVVFGQHLRLNEMPGLRANNISDVQLEKASTAVAQYLETYIDNCILYNRRLAHSILLVINDHFAKLQHRIPSIALAQYGHVCKTRQYNTRPWSKAEINLLCGMSILQRQHHSAICNSAILLNRTCADVARRGKKLQLQFQPRATLEKPAKNIFLEKPSKKWLDSCNTHRHEKRPTISGCSHQGPCQLGACSCVDAGVHCENYCGCLPLKCSYLFEGCNCSSSGENCSQSTCNCRNNHRECDPEICGCCDVKDTAFRRKRSTLQCANQELQCGMGSKIAKRKSKIQHAGDGLFAEEDICPNEFIAEYVGEVISDAEAERRDKRCAIVAGTSNPSSYLFRLLDTIGLNIDSRWYGNLTRYINHSTRANAKFGVVFADGSHRVKLTALRKIKKDEEILVNYGKSFLVIKSGKSEIE